MNSRIFVNKDHPNRWLRCDLKTKPCNFSINWPTPSDFNCKFFSCLPVTVVRKLYSRGGTIYASG